MGEKGLHALGGEAAGKERGMLLGNANIKAAVRMPPGEIHQAGAAWAWRR